MNPPPILALATALAMAACSGESPAPVPSDAAKSTAPATTAFPPAMLGRWGMVPADCTSQRGDNKGMITITSREIRFYESVATITAIPNSWATGLRVTLAFEGEGMQWTRDAQLEARPASDQLVMQEFGVDAVSGPQTYTRCPLAAKDMQG